MRSAARENLTWQIHSMLNSCVNCGLCAESCHYYCSTGESHLIPANKLKIVTKVLRTYFHPLRSRIPLLKGHSALDEPLLAEHFKAAYENCTLCAKCVLACPSGINTGEVLFLARAILYSIGRKPSGLDHPVETAFSVGNYLGLSTEDFIENMAWIAKEMAYDLRIKVKSIVELVSESLVL